MTTQPQRPTTTLIVWAQSEDEAVELANDLASTFVGDPTLVDEPPRDGFLPFRFELDDEVDTSARKIHS